MAWVPGHEGIAEQEASDERAKAGTEQTSSLPVTLTLTRAKRNSTEAMAACWTLVRTMHVLLFGQGFQFPRVSILSAFSHLVYPTTLWNANSEKFNHSGRVP